MMSTDTPCEDIKTDYEATTQEHRVASDFATDPRLDQKTRLRWRRRRRNVGSRMNRLRQRLERCREAKQSA